MGVKNGKNDFVKESKQDSLIINSEGKNLDIDLNQYNKIDHGYVRTIHKAVIQFQAKKSLERLLDKNIKSGGPRRNLKINSRGTVYY